MPIYEYRCTSCAERFEELLPASTASAPSCPSCGASEVTRIYSSFATEWKPSIVNWHRVGAKWEPSEARRAHGKRVPHRK